MEAPYLDRLHALFEQAIALPPDRRPWFLDHATADDRTLRRSLDSLLAYHDAQPSILGRQGDKVARAAANLAHATVNGGSVAIPPYVAHFRLIEELGEGGMGMVYKAYDTRLGRLVALKVLRPHLRTDGDANARLFNEAKTASALDHPNIATIYEIGATEPAPGENEGASYIAMAYYAGETLRTKIERGPLPLTETLGYAVQIVEGLVKAHANGITHRDIKPANLIATDEGLIKIVDFGLAKTADVSLTKSGAAVGTAAYMSPEQILGELVDDRTDIWSLGVVMYEMLAGQRPFRGDVEPAIFYSVLHAEPTPLTSLDVGAPAELAAIVNTCLRKDPHARYQTAAALRTDLLRVMAQLDRENPPEGNRYGAHALTIRSSASLDTSARRQASLLRRAVYLIRQFLKKRPPLLPSYDTTSRQ